MSVALALIQFLRVHSCCDHPATSLLFFSYFFTTPLTLFLRVHSCCDHPALSVLLLTVCTSKRDPAHTYSISGTLESNSLCVSVPISGKIAVKNTSSPVSAISLQLIRVEAIW